MIISHKSKFYRMPSNPRTQPAWFDYESMLTECEQYLIDEYIECQLHLNMCGPQDCQCPDAKLNWWLGRQEQIEDISIYMSDKYGVEFDKFYNTCNYPLMYENMSEKSKENYRRIIGRPGGHDDVVYSSF
jgi:hypothetical protein